MGEFEGQVAVVTGGARGIGAEIARRFARGGATVVCADVLDTTEIEEEISAAGGKAEGRELDVTNSTTAAETVAAIHETHGKIDILVNLGRTVSAGVPGTRCRTRAQDGPGRSAHPFSGRCICC